MSRKAKYREEGKERISRRRIIILGKGMGRKGRLLKESDMRWGRGRERMEEREG